MKPHHHLQHSVFNQESTRLRGVDPLAVLRGLTQLNGPESVGYFEMDSQFVVLGITPLIVLVSRDGVTKVERAGDIQTLHGNPLDVLQSLMTERGRVTLPELGFFTGGALGYLSYESIRFLESSLQDKGQLASAKKNPDAEFVFFRFYAIFDRVQNRVILLDTESSGESESLNKLESQLVVALSAPPGALRSGTQQAMRPSDAKEIPLEAMQSSLGKSAFIAGVKTLKHHIRQGDIFQAVLSEQFTHRFERNPVDLFVALKQVNPAPYHFYFCNQGRSFIGASPEMLVRVRHGEMETHPIAGTRPRGATPADETKNERQLLRSIKERAEHLMLVDLARNDLGRTAQAGSVKVESFMKIKKFGGVMHLVSRVTAKLKTDLTSLQALASCFPAGTLSGAPKVRAMELLAEMESEPRGFYGGAFVALSLNGDLESCINIRSISVQNQVATIQAGAGVVADSNPEKEYQEVQHKSRMCRQALALALEGRI